MVHIAFKRNPYTRPILRRQWAKSRAAKNRAAWLKAKYGFGWMSHPSDRHTPGFHALHNRMTRDNAYGYDTYNLAAMRNFPNAYRAWERLRNERQWRRNAVIRMRLYRRRVDDYH